MIKKGKKDLQYFKNKSVAVVGAGMIAKPLIDLIIKDEPEFLVIFTKSSEECKYINDKYS